MWEINGCRFGPWRGAPVARKHGVALVRHLQSPRSRAVAGPLFCLSFRSMQLTQSLFLALPVPFYRLCGWLRCLGLGCRGLGCLGLCHGVAVFSQDAYHSWAIVVFHHRAEIERELGVVLKGAAVRQQVKNRAGGPCAGRGTAQGFHSQACELLEQPLVQPVIHRACRDHLRVHLL